MRSLQRSISVYNAVMFEEDCFSVQEHHTSNGRNPQLIAARDNFLCHRFYWKSKIERMPYMDAIAELSSEVWLSKLQIQKILQSKADDVLLIKKQAPPAKELLACWPHIKW